MSELRINILDASRAVNGTLHGSLADSILAGLAAEPETIEELEHAMTRFAKPADNERHLWPDSRTVSTKSRGMPGSSSWIWPHEFLRRNRHTRS